MTKHIIKGLLFGLLVLLSDNLVNAQSKKVEEQYEKIYEAQEKLQKNPLDINATRSLADTYADLGDLGKALIYINQSLALYEDLEESRKKPKLKAHLHYLRANIRQYQGRYQGALNELHQAKNDIDANKKESLLLDIGFNHYQINQKDSAYHFYQLITDLYPDSFRAFYNLGNLYLEKENEERALSMYQKSFEKKADWKAPLLKIIEINLKQNDYDTVIAYADKWLENYPNDLEILFKKGNAEYRLPKLKNSIKTWDRILEIEEDNADALRNKGLVLLMQNNNKKALKYFESALVYSPSDPYLLLNLAYACIRLKKWNEALVALDKSILEEGNQALPYYYRALVQKELEDKINACNNLEMSKILGMEEFEMHQDILNYCSD